MKANLQAVGMQARLNGSSDSILAASRVAASRDFRSSGLSGIERALEVEWPIWQKWTSAVRRIAHEATVDMQD